MENKKNRSQSAQMERDFDFDQIGIKLEHSVVRVDNDAVLKQYMGLSFKHAMELSRRIRKMYRKQYSISLKITTTSLAVELLAHFVVQEICLKFKKVFGTVGLFQPLMKFCDRMLVHMEVIDCGEKYCDNNRFLWDWLSIPIVIVQKIRKSRKED